MKVTILNRYKFEEDDICLCEVSFTDKTGKVVYKHEKFFTGIRYKEEDFTKKPKYCKVKFFSKSNHVIIDIKRKIGTKAIKL